MPRKGMRNLFFSSKGSVSSLSQSYPSTPARALSEASVDRILAISESMIMRWNSDTSTYAKVNSLFHENRREARAFIRCVNELQKSMHSLVTEDSNSEKLVRGQYLMEIAMKRLQKEFYQILSMNRAHLDPESVSARSSRASTISSMSDYDDEELAEDDIRSAGESILEVEDASNAAMADLRAIAECMISSGYAKECLKIYKIIRKSIIDEGIYKLGVEEITSSQIQKTDWTSLELRINNWLSAVRIAVKTLFNGERILCDHVFAASDSIRESCFAEITKEGAHILFGFPEHVAKAGKTKKTSPEKVFRLLDMYTAIAGHWPDIESIFSFESTSAVVSQAIASLSRLGESVRASLTEFEAEIDKDSSKSPPVHGAGVHPLTVRVMDYLTLLADYSNVLADILAGHPPPSNSSLPASYFDSSDSDDFPAPEISLRFAWLILVLLCKLDGKGNHYKEISLGYLFLANNIQHVVNKVRTSNIKYLLGDEWLTNHEAKVKQFAANYERLGWGHVIGSLPEDPTAEMSVQGAREVFRRFNLSFEQAHRKQSVCVVQDGKLRDEIKVSIARKVVGPYREFYDTHRAAWRGQRDVVKYAPEDLGNYLSDLFFGGVGSGSSSSFSSTSSSSSLSRPSRSPLRS